MLATCPTPKLENHPLSAVRDCLFSIFAATLHIGGRSSIRNLRTRHAVVTETHLSRSATEALCNCPVSKNVCILSGSWIHKRPRSRSTVFPVRSLRNALCPTRRDHSFKPPLLTNVHCPQLEKKKHKLSSSYICHGVGPLLTRSGLTYPEVSSKVYHDSFCPIGSSVSLTWVIDFEAFYLHVVSSFCFIPLICPKLVLF